MKRRGPTLPSIDLLPTNRTLPGSLAGFGVFSEEQSPVARGEITLAGGLRRLRFIHKIKTKSRSALTKLQPVQLALSSRNVCGRSPSNNKHFVWVCTAAYSVAG
jgi:hypothetical protein